MSRTLLSALMTAALLFAASAVADPQLPPTDPPWYLRQDAWQETRATVARGVGPLPHREP